MGLVSTEDLMKVTGYKTAAHIEFWLQKNRIPYFRGKERKIIPTIDKINDALDGEKNRMKSIEFGNGSKA